MHIMSNINKDTASALAASFNSPPGVRTSSSRPITANEVINLEANLEAAGDSMLQSANPPTQLDDVAPPLRNLKPPGAMTITDPSNLPLFNEITKEMISRGTHLAPSGKQKQPWMDLLKLLFYGYDIPNTGHIPGVMQKYIVWTCQNPETKLRTMVLGGLQKLSLQYEEKMISAEQPTDLETRSYQMLRDRNAIFDEQKQKSQDKAAKALEKKNKNKAAEKDMGLRAEKRGVNAPPVPSLTASPAIARGTSHLGVRPMSEGKNRVDHMLGTYVYVYMYIFVYHIVCSYIYCVISSCNR